MKTHALLSAVAASLTTLLGAYSAHATCLSLVTATNEVSSYGVAHPAIGTPTPSLSLVQQSNTGWRQAYTLENANIWIKQCSGFGPHIVQGTIEDHYITIGGAATSPLGYPTSDEGETVSSDGRISNFENGAILFSASSHHTFSVQGFIWDRYSAINTTLSGLGYPTADEQTFSNSFFSGDISDFDNGWIAFDSALSGGGPIQSTFPIFNVGHASANGQISGSVSNPTQEGGTVQVTVSSGFGNNSNVFLFLDNWQGRTLLQSGTTNSSGFFEFEQETLSNADAGGGNSTSGFVVSLEVFDSTMSHAEVIGLNLQQ